MGCLQQKWQNYGNTHKKYLEKLSTETNGPIKKAVQYPIYACKKIRYTLIHKKDICQNDVKKCCVHDGFMRVR